MVKYFIVFLFLALGSWAFIFSGSDSTELKKDKSTSSVIETAVVVAEVRKGDFTIYQSGLGTVKPLNVVEVSSRVDGPLISLNFIEGQMVTAGDLLAKIDPTPFQAELKLAKGRLAIGQAILNKAKRDLDRHRVLLTQDSTSLQAVESKELEFRQHLSAVEADKGAIGTIELQLEYANIIAPISGRLGFRQIDIGNIIRSSSEKGIVTISQLDPISVIFPIPEDVLPMVFKQLRQDKKIVVDIYDRGMKNKITEGFLLAVDNEIDISTGTIKLKAEVPNGESKLFANQFVNVRMPVEHISNATLVPTPAIQYGAPGTFIYIIDKENKAIVTPVVVSATQGEITAINSDIPVGGRVVIEGADRLRSGAKVKIISGAKSHADEN